MTDPSLRAHTGFSSSDTQIHRVRDPDTHNLLTDSVNGSSTNANTTGFSSRLGHKADKSHHQNAAPEVNSPRNPTDVVGMTVTEDEKPLADGAFNNNSKEQQHKDQQQQQQQQDPSDAQTKRTVAQRIAAFPHAFGKALWNIVTSSWINLLLVFVPVGIAVAQFESLKGPVAFSMNAVAIIPLAGLLSFATESVAAQMGDAIGALMNVTFGNAVELIIFM